MYFELSKCVEKQMLNDYQYTLCFAENINFVSRYDCCDPCTVFMVELQYKFRNLQKIRFRSEQRKTGKNYNLFGTGPIQDWATKLLIQP